MIRSRQKKFTMLALVLTLACAIALTPASRIDAADHGDAPYLANDRGADLADAYFFLDPADNTRVIVAGTINGFIVPGEMVNFGIFDENLRYRFEVENTGDARPDLFIDVTFTRKQSSSTQVQVATVNFSTGQSFTAPATVPNLNPTPPDPVVTANSATGIQFFAGVTDDPFNFDIPGFNRYVAAQVGCGAGGFASACTDAAKANLQRGRDTFAGYNIMSIVMSIPRDLLRAPGGNSLGLNFVTQRRTPQILTTTQTTGTRAVGVGRYVQVDRIATPGVNVALTTFARKDEFNSATPIDDANGRFANSIVGTLRALNTDDTSIGILASIAVANGDYLRLNLNTANTNVGLADATTGARDGAGFPNGRRFGDDVIDTTLFLINNRVALSDNANTQEIPFRTAFPYIAPSHQPFPPGTVDDRSRN